MRKLYLLGLLGISATAFAQNAPKVHVPAKVQDATAIAQRINDVFPQSPVRVNPAQRNSPSVIFGKNARTQLVGRSNNDQQTNASIYDHVHVFPDGKVSVTWTTSVDANPYNQRGSGYNHFDGAVWGEVSMQRIEAERAGFPNYSYNPTTNEEIIISHRVKQGTNQAGGLFMNRKTGLGAGTWTSNLILDTTLTYPGVLWPRSIVSGDYLHVFASYTDSSENQPNRVVINGIRTPQVYSRYQFSTSTWLDKNILLPDYDTTRYYIGGGDNYSIHAKDSIIAILVGGLTDDLALWKSTDNGSTWTKTIIDSFPVPAYDYKTLFDTAYSNDGAVNVLIDNAGKVHCFWSLARVRDGDISDNNVSYWPGQVRLQYWQEGWPTVIYDNPDSTMTIAGMLDVNGNNQIDLGTDWNNSNARYGNHSIVTMPSSGISADGKIYVIYSALAEGDELSGQNYRDIYGVFSEDDGNTWSVPVNLTDWINLNTEQIFGSMARLVNGKVHITYMEKGSIGRYSVDNPGAAGPYDIYYMAVDTSAFRTRTITALNEVENTVFNSVQNYPNPYKGMTNIAIELNKATAVSVVIRNVVGQEVYNKNFGTLSTGHSNLEIHTPTLQSGVYFYEVVAGGFKSSGKMIVE